MYVIKRDGQKEPVLFDKITERLRRLCVEAPPLSDKVEPVLIAQKVVAGLVKGIKTSQLDTLAAETAAYLSTTHPGYGELAARIAISNLQKETPKTFYEAMKLEYDCTNVRTGEPGPLLSDEVWQVINENRELIETQIVHQRDYSYDYFGFRTMERSYLAKVNGKIVERPQYMLMRVAIGIHKKNLEMAFKTYDYMSTQWFTHATPTLFNAGTRTPQMSSCYLVSMKDDSIEGIYDTLKTSAVISKGAGGLGIAMHCIRAKGSYIRGSAGESNGLVPMLRNFNETARYVDQGPLIHS